MVADHEEPTIADLDHFVAVQNGVIAALAGRDPVFVGAVAEAAVTDVERGGRIAGGGAERLNPSGGGGGGETGEEVAAGEHGIFWDFEFGY
jgi:hypothetical protein